MDEEKEIVIDFSSKKTWVAIGFVAILLVVCLVWASSVMWQRHITTSVTIQSSYDLSITYAETGVEAYALDFGTIPQGGAADSDILCITYVGNNESGVLVNWVAFGLPYAASLTAKENSTGLFLSWPALTSMIHLDIGESFYGQWFFQDNGALAGTYSFDIVINSNSL